MNLFFSKQISKDTTIEILSDTESQHCIKSLRHKVDDRILVSNGKGEIYNAKIINIEKKQVIYQNLGLNSFNQKSKKIHIAIAPPKNKTRFEWFLEKVTEIGVDIISPIICENSERDSINQQRCNKILISAMKQSKTGVLPILNAPVPFQVMAKNNIEESYIAYCSKHHEIFLKKITKEKGNSKEIILFIGPEGDFSQKEINFAKSIGIKPVSLGNSILRTETAGVVGCTIINLSI